MLNGLNSENGMSREGSNEAGDRLEVISYLAQMGLGESDLNKVASLLHAIRAQELPQPVAGEDSPPVMVGEDLLQTMQGEDLLLEPSPATRYTDTARPMSPVSPTGKKVIKLYLAEEQQLLREAYHSFLKAQPDIQLLGSAGVTSSEELGAAVSALKPDVVLFGVKMLRAATVEMLADLREVCPNGSIVLLFAFFEVQAIRALREYSKDAVSGYAYLLKHKIDAAGQLAQVIFSVAEGRVIVDPEVMVELVEADEGYQNILRQLSPREMEVLSWMARGYTNSTITGLLDLDISVVERHIKSIYRKLHDDQPESTNEPEDRRVRAALLYLKATGSLSTEPILQH